MMATDMTLKEWLPILGMTCSAFIFNTSEFIPIGLLTDIASEFNITEAHAGSMISVYAWIVTLLSLPLMLLVCKMEFRKLLLATLALFGCCQIISAISQTFPILLLSRIGVACSHAVFWSIASPLAVRVVSEQHRSLALSLIVTGTSVAMIFGLPFGRMIGLYIGWRMTFVCVSSIAFAILVYLAFVFPRIENRSAFSLKKLPKLFQNKALQAIYLLSFAVATSYYIGYSYIEPFLKQVAGLSDQLITATLIIFGAFGICGSLMFSHYYDRRPHQFNILSTFSIAVSLLLLYPSSNNVYTVVALCAFWGMSVTAYNVAFQAETIKHASQDSTAIAMSVFSSIFNLGIGCGTFIGGFICTYSSMANLGYIGGILALFASVYCILRVRKCQ